MRKDFMAPYKAFHSLSEEMLSCARQGDWIHLAATEQKRAEIKTALKEAPQTQAPVDAQEEAYVIIQKIIAMDQETKDRILSRMASLKKNAHSEKKLIKAYGMSEIL